MVGDMLETKALELFRQARNSTLLFTRWIIIYHLLSWYHCFLLSSSRWTGLPSYSSRALKLTVRRCPGPTVCSRIRERPSFLSFVLLFAFALELPCNAGGRLLFHAMTDCCGIALRSIRALVHPSKWELLPVQQTLQALEFQGGIRIFAPLIFDCHQTAATVPNFNCCNVLERNDTTLGVPLSDLLSLTNKIPVIVTAK